MNRFIILFLFSLGILSTCVFAVEVIPLNEGWNFHRGFQAPASEIVKVTLPHTWNAGDGMFGNADYYRGLCNYSRKLSVPAHYRGKRFFLKVMAAQTVADIFIDHHFVMQHKGGYTAFVAELTDFLVPGTESVLEIRVSNAQTMDVAPICGDFNMFGGLYRGVELLVTEDVCIEPAYYASSGVFFTQSDVSEKKAHLKIEALLSARETTVTGCEVEFRLYDKEKLLCRVASAEVGEDKKVMMDIVLERPHLWDGVKNPYLYKGVVILRKDGKEIDRREEEIGFRYFHADAEKGFFLNGKPYRLNGVNRHQDPAYDENLRLQLKELILQNYNHPCILFWGLFNEINSGWLDRPSRMAAELHALARQLDPSRPTMGASNQDDDFNGFTDLIAFNKYFGWYGDNMDDMGRWIDREHAAHPERKMGISEYGAGACVFQQEDSLRHPEPWGQWHPENWQTYYHVENWKQLQEREFLWCNFIWCMFDFSAAGRREGSIMGRNDKGLVTYDRKIKKDAFYFYKANWNQEDKFVYIAGKRLVNRTRKTVDVQVFSNSGAAKLYINGKAYGTAKPDSVNVLEWKGIVLDTGENRIEVRNKYGADCCVWICPF